MSVISFTKVSGPYGYGWLSNMSRHPIMISSMCYPTAEHLFQALRFPVGSPIRDEICTQRSPMSAKMVAKKYVSQMIVTPRSEVDVFNMRFVLLCKIHEHPELIQKLLATYNAEIIEDVSSRPTESGLFWGARKVGSGWYGENRLGKLWMGIREEHALRKQAG